MDRELPGCCGCCVCCASGLAAIAGGLLAGDAVAYAALAFSAVGGQGLAATVLVLTALAHAALAGAACHSLCARAARPLCWAIVFVPAVFSVAVAVDVKLSCDAADSCASALVFRFRLALIAAGVLWAVGLVFSLGCWVQGVAALPASRPRTPPAGRRAPPPGGDGYDPSADDLSLDFSYTGPEFGLAYRF